MDETDDIPAASSDGEFGQEEARIAGTLHERRDKLLAAIDERAVESAAFGRAWPIVAGIAVFVGAGLSSVEPISRNISDLFYLLTFILCIMTIGVAIFFSRHFKPVFRGIAQAMLPALSLFLWAVLFITMQSHISDDDWLTALIVGIGIPLIGYPVAVAIGFGPFASCVVRMHYPKSRFARLIGVISGLLFMAGIPVAIGGYIMALADTRREWEVASVMFCVMGMTVAALMPIIAIANTISTGAEKIRERARIAVIAGFISLGLHIAGVAVIIIYLCGRRWVDIEDILMYIAGVICGVGIIIAIANGASTLLLEITRRKWEKQAREEIARLDIELDSPS